VEEKLALLERLKKALGGRLGAHGWGRLVATDEAAEALVLDSAFAGYVCW
jgi:hypothetical protein